VSIGRRNAQKKRVEVTMKTWDNSLKGEVVGYVACFHVVNKNVSGPVHVRKATPDRPGDIVCEDCLGKTMDGNLAVVDLVKVCESCADSLYFGVAQKGLGSVDGKGSKEVVADKVQVQQLDQIQ